jgi:hypothetical protein
MGHLFLWLCTKPELEEIGSIASNLEINTENH